MRKRKTPQYDRVDDGELSCRRADPQTENKHGQKAKGFVLKQYAQSDAHILTK
jgi:hypothetical protein